MVHLSPKKLILFGGACSPVTDQIAKAARHWNLVQLTYADTHPMFTEKSFPHFYRVVPSENEFNPPRLSILRYFNWTRVGTLYQNSAKYALVSYLSRYIQIFLKRCSNNGRRLFAFLTAGSLRKTDRILRWLFKVPLQNPRSERYVMQAKKWKKRKV